MAKKNPRPPRKQKKKLLKAKITQSQLDHLDRRMLMNDMMRTDPMSALAHMKRAVFQDVLSEYNPLYKGA